MDNLYCNFIETDMIFNGKKVYKCSYCGLTLSLEDPEVSMLCFKKMTDTKNTLRQMHNSEPIHIGHTTQDKLSDFIYDQIQSEINTDEDLCTKEEIDARLKICNSCEHYQNDTCELCGCHVVRDQNYMNKLAHKSASCPADKWLPILT